MRYSQAYVQHLKSGPFPGRIDPWAEAGRYFHQIHSGVIDHMLSQIQDSLLEMGYVASREISLQIAERREPDISVRREDAEAYPIKYWDYEGAAASLLIEPGVAVEWETPELEAIYVTHMETGDLVSVIEIVSPSNKADQATISEYIDRRSRLLRTRGVNVVEVDLTRSIKHLLQDVLTSTYVYHIAIYLPGRVPRLVGADFEEALKRFALPLREEVIPIETQAAYDFAYRLASVAAQMRKEGFYTEHNLPFPTLLTNKQGHDALRAVETWQTELVRLSKA